ncbi:MAG: Protein translocase subunit SecD / Protein translocase subunit SecF [uncultured Nocardioidaceae bacterium]|uniref:Multifunctional fusion protein n=1 Tax=uncultured Nocardioidaceae bacterium TaxID=253824 RepID=A0A6J4MGB5_9ACTN|nr:MAG: Protein translocase subunit SecD / Protein translocase subunit SecF [uncultured Nocardioidaceae bacterium]
MGPMSRASLIRLVVALLILAGSVAIALQATPKLGLDLRGGTQIVLETQDAPTVEADAEATDRTLEVLRGRVDALGVAEPTLARSGEQRIIVELPGLQDPREAAEVIGRTAQLSFHPVLGPGRRQDLPKGKSSQPAGNGPRTLRDEDGRPLRLGPVAVPGDEVTGAAPGNDPSQGTGWFVTVDFRGSGEGWAQLTGEAACNQPGDPRRRVAIVLDQQVISSPEVNPGVGCGVGIAGGSTQITGNFTAESASELAVLIEGGALPVPVEIIEQRTVGPTLGADAIAASAQAGVIGLILTGLFIAVVYRLMGALATLALGCYALLSYAALVALGATLTLPGLAGFVLAIGMAIDANVLVFERAREEYTGEKRPGLRNALSTGYNKAWTAIIDSNVTTLLAAALLFLLASGPVKGFGVTLSIGVLASMVSALVIARVLTEQAAASRWVQRHPAVTGLSTTGRVRDALRRWNPDIMGRGRLWLSASAAALVLAVVGIAVNGLSLGVEFTGGRLMEYSTSQPVGVEQAREAVADAGFPNAVVQESDNDKIAVRTGQISNQDQVDIQESIGSVAGGATKQRDELIGPSLGSELRDKALIAFAIALLAQMLYLGVRFKWTIGASAVAAMFHDVVLVVGVFAWLGKPIDGVFLAAALTIIGLSVNDSVVVFDRVRERWLGSRGADYQRVANDAVLETMPRTVNTGLGSMFILAALAILGGDSLRDFAIALLLGLVVGTYSSVFTATPLSVLLHRRWPMSAAVRAKAPRSTRDPQDSGAVI